MEKTWLTMFKSFPQCLPFTIVAKLWFELRFFSNSKNAFQYNRELWILTTGKAYFEITFRSLWASLVAQLVKNPPAMQETWVGKIPWRRERLPTPVFWSGEFHGLYSPWGRKELDTTGWLSLSSLYFNNINFISSFTMWGRVRVSRVVEKK